MITGKKLGIWIDHSCAHLMEFTVGHIYTSTIESEFTHQDEMHSLNQSEKMMHVKEQHQQSEYFRKLAETIRNYHEVILFGPTDAKTELLNILRADQRFAGIKIEIRQTGKMTENQEHAFVREHFSEH